MSPQEMYLKALHLAQEIQDRPHTYKEALRAVSAAADLVKTVCDDLRMGKGHQMSGRLKWNGKLANRKDPMGYLGLVSPTHHKTMEMSLLFFKLFVYVVGLKGKKLPPDDLVEEILGKE